MNSLAVCFSLPSTFLVVFGVEEAAVDCFLPPSFFFVSGAPAVLGVKALKDFTSDNEALPEVPPNHHTTTPHPACFLLPFTICIHRMKQVTNYCPLASWGSFFHLTTPILPFCSMFMKCSFISFVLWRDGETCSIGRNAESMFHSLQMRFPVETILDWRVRRIISHAHFLLQTAQSKCRFSLLAVLLS